MFYTSGHIAKFNNWVFLVVFFFFISLKIHHLIIEINIYSVPKLLLYGLEDTPSQTRSFTHTASRTAPNLSWYGFHITHVHSAGISKYKLQDTPTPSLSFSYRSLRTRPLKHTIVCVQRYKDTPTQTPSLFISTYQTIAHPFRAVTFTDRVQSQSPINTYTYPYKALWTRPLRAAII